MPGKDTSDAAAVMLTIITDFLGVDDEAYVFLKSQGYIPAARRIGNPAGLMLSLIIDRHFTMTEGWGTPFIGFDMSLK